MPQTEAQQRAVRKYREANRERINADRRKGSSILTRVPTDPVVLAYAAGILDGEGSISIVHSSPTSYSLNVTVANTYRPLIEWLVHHFGGTFTRYPATDKWRERFYWRLHGPNAATLLEAILPFMVIKRQQATLAVELVALTVGRGSTVSDAVNVRRAIIKSEIERLNAGR